MREADLRAAVVGRLCTWYGLEPVDVTDDRPLAELGLTSRDAVAMTAALGELTGARLPVTLLWESPTLGSLLARLVHGVPVEDAQVPSPAAGLHAPDGDTAVAVVGAGCRLPGGVTSPAGFWELLREGGDAVGTVPEGRWTPFLRSAADGLPDDMNRHGGFLSTPRTQAAAEVRTAPAVQTATGMRTAPPAQATDRARTHAGVDAIAGFDAEFFGIGAHEATAMDPQQRILLEVTREALDHAALPATSLAGTRTGVFVGISGNEYAHLTTADPTAVDAWTAPGSSMSVASGRLSYALDLRGPSLSLDTACSSSLVAVHHAVRSLISGESDTALAAGVNLLLSPAVTIGFQRAGALAADGRCKAFDAAADGIVRSEGCGVVVLKRLADAERDGDRVLAVIKSTGVNSDGRSNGLTAPRADAQHTLLAQTHTEPVTVDYVEAHGTGTALGDPIEAGALGAALGAGRGRAADRPLLIGSVKTNLGHLEAAAGITGLIKTVLALHHGEIPPQLHFDEPGPHADLDGLGLRVVTQPEPWPRYSGTATAGVSAFGFGGTNAHVALAEYRPPPTPAPAAAAAAPESARPVLLLMDGPSEDRVRAYAGELAEWLGTPASRPVRPADLARTLAGRTGRGRHRTAVVARGRGDIVTTLERYATGGSDPALVTGTAHRRDGRRGPVWVFSGYGSQWPAMGRELLSTEPVFAATVDRMAGLLREHCGLSLHDLLLPDAELSAPDTVMPVLYAVQIALAELWRSYGAEPAAVIGHSMGEVAAAVVSGALDEATGARVIAVRSRLLSRLSGGAMAVVDRSGGEIAGLARRFASGRVAVHASPVQSVVTGSAADVAGLVAQVNAEGGFARSLGVTAAGHSSAVEPLLDEFARELGTVPHSPPRCTRYSTVRDDPRSAADCDAGYWVANLRQPVRFEQAVRAAAEDGHRVFVEVSPHPTQLHPLSDTLTHALGGAGTASSDGSGAAHEDFLVVPTLRRDTDDALTFRSSLATLLVHGVAVTGAREGLNPGGRIVDVPVPRWRHRRFWAGESAGPGAAPVHPVRPGPGTGVIDRLRHCVAAVMGYGPDRIDPDTPLTELGLDSLTAVRVRTVVEREFDVVVEPGVLLRQGTLRGVAALLAKAPDGPRLRDGAPDTDAAGTVSGTPGRLRTFPGAGPLAPLFLAHAAGGSSDVYGRLAARLDGSRPVLGLDRLPDPDDVPGRAAEFARRIREVRPDGPWLVGGWSYGGLLAQETARLLSAHGTVAALVLLDSVLPLPVPPGAATPDREVRRRFEGFAEFVERTYGQPLRLPYGELARCDDAGQVALVIKLLEQVVELPPAVLEHQRTSYLDLRSGERHTPRRYDGRTLLYRAADPAPHTVRDARYERDDEALGWDAYCTDLTVAPLPGHHLSLLDPPVVDVLADLLARDLPRT
ncbi:type I polyketide synthase [Streptomyces sp. RKAG290]|uniref:type I polyketide synthase n=1 Tax=Streptomyces sp. RKAG290 TaxID=2888348 RepID=UPI0020340E24|nr:type I polyketide synthase [Streptomyces sp. RKAG290]MCM2416038.1 acyltransferase domain-containing protein [Streptomyces sp. RKAG290]